MGIYYALWNVMLLLPGVVKLFVEVLIAALLILLLWPLDKHFVIALVWIVSGLNYLAFGGVRFILTLIPGERKYIWDDKLGQCGARNSAWLHDKLLGLRKSKRKDILHTKIAWFLLLCVYIVSILPVFHLEKHIPGRYINRVYTVNYFFVKLEEKLTAGIENYPPFWIREDEEEALEVSAEEVQVEEEEKEPVYLVLNEDTSYANIRESADIHSDSLCVVSNEDEILYQDMYEYDSERVWLKVVLPSKSDLEGWISANVIESEIVMSLDLQY